MRIGLFTDSLGAYPLDDVLDVAVELGVRDLEIGTGNYSPAPHCHLQELLRDQAARTRWLDGFERRGLRLCAFNCSGNPLHPDEARARAHDTVLAAFAAAQGVSKVCLELHPGMTVYNTHTLLRLRAEVGPTVAANLDPSHLLWQQMDPLAVIPALGDAIGYVHAKDVVLIGANMALNGLLDSRWLGPPRDMPWYFCTMGYGHDAVFWKQFALTLRAHGYDDVLGIEHEDPLLAPLDGVRKSVTFLEAVVPAE